MVTFGDHESDSNQGIISWSPKVTTPPQLLNSYPPPFRRFKSPGVSLPGRGSLLRTQIASQNPGIIPHPSNTCEKGWISVPDVIIPPTFSSHFTAIFPEKVVNMVFRVELTVPSAKNDRCADSSATRNQHDHTHQKETLIASPPRIRLSIAMNLTRAGCNRSSRKLKGILGRRLIAQPLAVRSQRIKKIVEFLHRYRKVISTINRIKCVGYQSFPAGSACCPSGCCPNRSQH